MPDIIYRVVVDDSGSMKIIQQVGDTFEDTGRKATSAVGAIGGQFSHLKEIIVGLWTTLVAAKIAEQIAEWSRALVEFETQWAAVTTLVSGDTAGLRAGFLELEGSLGSSTELAKGLYSALQSGVKPADSLKFITTASELATVALTDTASAVNALKITLTAYNLTVAEAGDTADRLWRIYRVGAGLTLPELATAIGKIGPFAARLNISLEEIGALLGTVRQGSTDVQRSMFGLNALFAALSDSNSKLSKTLKQSGIDLASTEMRSRGLAGIFKVLADAIGDDEATASQLGLTVQELRVLLQVTGTSAAIYAEKLAGATDKTQDLAKAHKQAEASLGKAWEALTASIERVIEKYTELSGATKFIQKLASDIPGYAQSMAANWNLIKDSILGATAAFVAMKAAIAGYGSLVAVFGELRTWQGVGLAIKETVFSLGALQAIAFAPAPPTAWIFALVAIGAAAGAWYGAWRDQSKAWDEADAATKRAIESAKKLKAAQDFAKTSAGYLNEVYKDRPKVLDAAAAAAEKTGNRIHILTEEEKELAKFQQEAAKKVADYLVAAQQKLAEAQGQFLASVSGKGDEPYQKFVAGMTKATLEAVKQYDEVTTRINKEGGPEKVALLNKARVDFEKGLAITRAALLAQYFAEQNALAKKAYDEQQQLYAKEYTARLSLETELDIKVRDLLHERLQYQEEIAGQERDAQVRALELAAATQVGVSGEQTVKQQLAFAKQRADIEIEYLQKVHDVKVTLFNLETQMILDQTNAAISAVRSQATAALMVQASMLENQRKWTAIYGEDTSALEAQIEAVLNQAQVVGDQVTETMRASAADIAAQREALKEQIDAQTDAAQRAVRENAAIQQAQIIRNEQKTVFNSLKDEAGKVFDALLTKSGDTWEAIAGLFKNTLLTAVKDIFSEIIATLLTPFISYLRNMLRGAFQGNWLTGVGGAAGGLVIPQIAQAAGAANQYGGYGTGTYGPSLAALSGGGGGGAGFGGLLSSLANPSLGTAIGVGAMGAGIGQVLPSPIGQTITGASVGYAGGAALGQILAGTSVFGPVGAAVGAFVGLVIGIAGMFGKGRKEADKIVPVQNQVTANFAAILDELNKARDAQTLTIDAIAAAKDQIISIRDEFFTFTQQFSRAGPGARATIGSLATNIIESLDQMTTDVGKELTEGMRGLSVLPSMASSSVANIVEDIGNALEAGTLSPADIERAKSDINSVMEKFTAFASNFGAAGAQAIAALQAQVNEALAQLDALANNFGAITSAVRDMSATTGAAASQLKVTNPALSAMFQMASNSISAAISALDAALQSGTLDQSALDRAWQSVNNVMAAFTTFAAGFGQEGSAAVVALQQAANEALEKIRSLHNSLGNLGTVATEIAGANQTVVTTPALSAALRFAMNKVAAAITTLDSALQSGTLDQDALDTAWADVNRVMSAFTTFAAGFGAEGGAAVAALQTVVNRALEEIRSLHNNLGSLGTVIAGINGAIGSQAQVAVKTPALSLALSAAMNSISGAISAVESALQAGTLNHGDLDRAWAAVNAVMAAFTTFAAGFGDEGAAAVAALQTAVNRALEEILSLHDNLGGLSDVMAGINGQLQAVIPGLENLSIVPDVASKKLTALAQNISTQLEAGTLTSTMIDQTITAIQAVLTEFYKFTQGLGPAGADAFNRVNAQAQEILKSLNALKANLPAITGAVNAITGVKIPGVPTPAVPPKSVVPPKFLLPEFASGGFTGTGPGPLLAVLHPGEFVLPKHFVDSLSTSFATRSITPRVSQSSTTEQAEGPSLRLDPVSEKAILEELENNPAAFEKGFLAMLRMGGAGSRVVGKRTGRL